MKEDDRLIQVWRTNGKNEIVLGTRKGQAIHFLETDVRSTGRKSFGVRGIRIREGDEVVDMVLVDSSKQLLTVATNGYGKRTGFNQYKLQKRGGIGLKNLKITEKTGDVVTLRAVGDDEEIMAVSTRGKLIRTTVDSIRSTGRVAQGVRIMRLDEDDQIAAIARVNLRSETSEEIQDEVSLNDEEE